MKKKIHIILLLLVIGIFLGLLLTGAYSATMYYTSTDNFCLSCHNHDIPYDEFKTTVHFRNAYGVTAECHDCHLPHDFIPKVTRKLAAAKEVYGHFTGVIDSDEKYMAHRAAMKAAEIKRLKNNDSAECRNCHDVKRMDFAAQSALASKNHAEMARGKTCIDCHQGIAHTPQDEESNFDI